MQDEVGEIFKVFGIEDGGGDVRVEVAHYVVVCEGGFYADFGVSIAHSRRK